MRLIIFERKAAQVFDNLSPPVRQSVEKDLIALAIARETVAHQIVALQGFDALRLRSGDWRIIFTETPISVRILFIGHRRDVYKKGSL